MTKVQRFINPQNTPVGVYTPQKRKIYLQPFVNQKFSTDTTDVFVVEGEHYQQYVAPGGPLACFPEVAAVPAAVAKVEGVDGSVDSQKSEGSTGDSEAPVSVPAVGAPADLRAGQGSLSGVGTSAAPVPPEPAVLPPATPTEAVKAATTARAAVKAVPVPPKKK